MCAYHSEEDNQQKDFCVVLLGRTFVLKKPHVGGGYCVHMWARCTELISNVDRYVYLECHRGKKSIAKMCQWMCERDLIRCHPMLKGMFSTPLLVDMDPDVKVARAICDYIGDDLFVQTAKLQKCTPDERRPFAIALCEFLLDVLEELSNIGKVGLLSDIKLENIIMQGNDFAHVSKYSFRVIDFGHMHEDLCPTLDAGGGRVLIIAPHSTAYKHPKRKYSDLASTRDVVFSIVVVYFTVLLCTNAHENGCIRKYVEYYKDSYVDTFLYDLYMTNMRSDDHDMDIGDIKIKFIQVKSKHAQQEDISSTSKAQLESGIQSIG